MWGAWKRLLDLRSPRKDRLIALSQPVLSRFVGPWTSLTDQQRQQLQKWAGNFVPRKHWEGCKELVLTDEMKLAIAGQIGLMVLGWQEPFYFDHVKSILVYPDAFVAPRQLSLGSGIHLQTEQALQGQAWYGGPVIVSWADVLAPASSKPNNLVIHEFAHQLDMLNGESADGLPPLPDWNRIRRWHEVFDRAQVQLSSACHEHEYTVLDCYGASSRAELFAVSCEAFFTAGSLLRAEYPDLYHELVEFFKLHTHEW